MAPEVYHKQPYNETCDIYAFALMAWELLTKSLIIMHFPINANLDTSMRSLAVDGWRPPLPHEWPLGTPYFLTPSTPLSRKPVRASVCKLTRIQQGAGVQRCVLMQGKCSHCGVTVTAQVHVCPSVLLCLARSYG